MESEQGRESTSGRRNRGRGRGRLSSAQRARRGLHPGTPAEGRHPNDGATHKSLSYVLFNGFIQFFIEVLNLVKTMAGSVQEKKMIMSLLSSTL